MLALFLISIWFQESSGHLKFIRPVGTVFAGSADFYLQTDIDPENILGIELFVNGRTEHYFENPPFETTLDLTHLPSGKITFKAVLELFDGTTYTAEASGENHPSFYEEEVRLVRVPVLTRETHDMEDFLLLENGKPQTPALLFGEEKPIELLVLLDLSGSMERRLFHLRTGVYTLIDMLKLGDSVHIVGFNHRIFEICPPETDFEAVKKRLHLIRADGSTNLFGAVWSAVKMMGQSNQRRAVILFTDGDHDLGDEPDIYQKTKEDCVTQAKENGVPIYTMGVGSAVRPETLQEFSDATGGKAFMLRGNDTLKQGFAEIGKELRHQYLLCYYTASTLSGWHDIEVGIAGKPEAELHYPDKIYFK